MSIKYQNETFMISGENGTVLNKVECGFSSKTYGYTFVIGNTSFGSWRDTPWLNRQDIGEYLNKPADDKAVTDFIDKNITHEYKQSKGTLNDFNVDGASHPLAVDEPSEQESDKKTRHVTWGDFFRQSFQNVDLMDVGIFCLIECLVIIIFMGAIQALF